MDSLDLYDDLDEFQEQQEKKSKELHDAEEKYQQSLQTIRSLEGENKALQKKIQRIELSFQSLLDTARTEIKRKDKEIDRLRKEKDDICFRRKLPHRSQETETKPFQQVAGNPFAAATTKETSTTDYIKLTENKDVSKTEKQNSSDRYKEDSNKRRSSRDAHNPQKRQRNEDDSRENKKERRNDEKRTSPCNKRDRYEKLDDRNSSRNRHDRDSYHKSKYSNFSESPERCNSRRNREREAHNEHRERNDRKNLSSSISRSPDRKSRNLSSDRKDRPSGHRSESRRHADSTKESSHSSDCRERHDNRDQSKPKMEHTTSTAFENCVRVGNNDADTKPMPSSETLFTTSENKNVPVPGRDILQKNMVHQAKSPSCQINESHKSVNTKSAAGNASERKEAKNIESNTSHRDISERNSSLNGKSNDPQKEAFIETKELKSETTKVNKVKELSNHRTSDTKSHTIEDSLYDNFNKGLEKQSSSCETSIQSEENKPKDSQRFDDLLYENLDIEESSEKTKDLCTPRKVALFDAIFGPSHSDGNILDSNTSRNLLNNIKDILTKTGNSSTTTSPGQNCASSLKETCNIFNEPSKNVGTIDLTEELVDKQDECKTGLTESREQNLGTTYEEIVNKATEHISKLDVEELSEAKENNLKNRNEEPVNDLEPGPNKAAEHISTLEIDDKESSKLDETEEFKSRNTTSDKTSETKSAVERPNLFSTVYIPGLDLITSEINTTEESHLFLNKPNDIKSQLKPTLSSDNKQIMHSAAEEDHAMLSEVMPSDANTDDLIMENLKSSEDSLYGTDTPSLDNPYVAGAPIPGLDLLCAELVAIPFTNKASTEDVILSSNFIECVDSITIPGLSLISTETVTSNPPEEPLCSKDTIPGLDLLSMDVTRDLISPKFLSKEMSPSKNNLSSPQIDENQEQHPVFSSISAVCPLPCLSLNSPEVSPSIKNNATFATDNKTANPKTFDSNMPCLEPTPPLEAYGISINSNESINKSIERVQKNVSPVQKSVQASAEETFYTSSIESLNKHSGSHLTTVVDGISQISKAQDCSIKLLQTSGNELKQTMANHDIPCLDLTSPEDSQSLKNDATTTLSESSSSKTLESGQSNSVNLTIDNGDETIGNAKTMVLPNLEIQRPEEELNTDKNEKEKKEELEKNVIEIYDEVNEKPADSEKKSEEAYRELTHNGKEQLNSQHLEQLNDSCRSEMKSLGRTSLLHERENSAEIIKETNTNYLESYQSANVDQEKNKRIAQEGESEELEKVLSQPDEKENQNNTLDTDILNNQNIDVSVTKQLLPADGLEDVVNSEIILKNLNPASCVPQKITEHKESPTSKENSKETEKGKVFVDGSSSENHDKLNKEQMSSSNQSEDFASGSLETQANPQVEIGNEGVISSSETTKNTNESEKFANNKEANSVAVREDNSENLQRTDNDKLNIIETDIETPLAKAVKFPVVQEHYIQSSSSQTTENVADNSKTSSSDSHNKNLTCEGLDNSEAQIGKEVSNPNKGIAYNHQEDLTKLQTMKESKIISTENVSKTKENADGENTQNAAIPELQLIPKSNSSIDPKPANKNIQNSTNAEGIQDLPKQNIKILRQEILTLTCATQILEKVLTTSPILNDEPKAKEKNLVDPSTDSSHRNLINPKLNTMLQTNPLKAKEWIQKRIIINPNADSSNSLKSSSAPQLDVPKQNMQRRIVINTMVDSSNTLKSSTLSDCYNSPTELPSISTNCPTPSNFSGIFSKKPLDSGEDLMRNKKRLFRPKEYILPAASVLCNRDNLENATKPVALINKKLHWELLENKNEMTEIEDDTDIESTDEEQPTKKVMTKCSKNGTLKGKVTNTKKLTLTYAKDAINKTNVETVRTQEGAFVHPNQTTRSKLPLAPSKEATKISALPNLKTKTVTKKPKIVRRRNTIDTIPYYKQLEEELENFKDLSIGVNESILPSRPPSEHLTNTAAPAANVFHHSLKGRMSKKLRDALIASSPKRLRSAENRKKKSVCGCISSCNKLKKTHAKEQQIESKGKRLTFRKSVLSAIGEVVVGDKLENKIIQEHSHSLYETSDDNSDDIPLSILKVQQEEMKKNKKDSEKRAISITEVPSGEVIKSMEENKRNHVEDREVIEISDETEFKTPPKKAHLPKFDLPTISVGKDKFNINASSGTEESPAQEERAIPHSSIVYHKEHSSDELNSSLAENSEPECNKYIEDSEVTIITTNCVKTKADKSETGIRPSNDKQLLLSSKDEIVNDIETIVMSYKILKHNKSSVSAAENQGLQVRSFKGNNLVPLGRPKRRIEASIVEPKDTPCIIECHSPESSTKGNKQLGKQKRESNTINVTPREKESNSSVTIQGNAQKEYIKVHGKSKSISANECGKQLKKSTNHVDKSDRISESVGNDINLAASLNNNNSTTLSKMLQRRKSLNIQRVIEDSSSEYEEDEDEGIHVKDTTNLNASNNLPLDLKTLTARRKSLNIQRTCLSCEDDKGPNLTHKYIKESKIESPQRDSEKSIKESKNKGTNPSICVSNDNNVVLSKYIKARSGYAIINKQLLESSSENNSSKKCNKTEERTAKCSNQSKDSNGNASKPIKTRRKTIHSLEKQSTDDLIKEQNLAKELKSDKSRPVKNEKPPPKRRKSMYTEVNHLNSCEESHPGGNNKDSLIINQQQEDSVKPIRVRRKSMYVDKNSLNVPEDLRDNVNDIKVNKGKQETNNLAESTKTLKARRKSIYSDKANSETIDNKVNNSQTDSINTYDLNESNSGKVHYDTVGSCRQVKEVKPIKSLRMTKKTAKSEKESLNISAEKQKDKLKNDTNKSKAESNVADSSKVNRTMVEYNTNVVKPNNVGRSSIKIVRSKSLYIENPNLNTDQIEPKQINSSEQAIPIDNSGNQSDSDISLIHRNISINKLRRASVSRQCRILDSSDDEVELPIPSKSSTQRQDILPATVQDKDRISSLVQEPGIISATVQGPDIIPATFQEHDRLPVPVGSSKRSPRKRRVVKVLSSSYENSPTVDKSNQISHNLKTMISPISPTHNHPIFHTQVSDESQPNINNTTSFSQDDRFKEIDSNMQVMFQSPQREIELNAQPASDAMQSLVSDPLDNSIPNLTIDETVYSNQENEQSSLNVSQDSKSLNCNTSTSNNVSEAKHLSLGSSQYRFEKVSENVVNLFISRKRKRKRPN